MKQKRFLHQLLLTGHGLLLVSLFTAQGRGTGQEPVQSWDKEMSALGQVFSDLLPRIVRSADTLSPEDWQSIRENTQRLNRLAHEVDRQAKAGIPGRDPALGYIAGLFQRETARALEALQSEDRDAALGRLRGITSHCLACHSQSSTPEALADGTVSPAIQKLNAIEKADFLAATRRFDSALDQFERIILDPTLLETRDLKWNNAVRWALSIAIRVQKNPQRALRLIQAVLSRPDVPLYYQEYARAWDQSLREWISEAPLANEDRRASFSEAQRLIDKAASLDRYPADHTGDIYLLRALSVLHELLEEEPRGKGASRSLLAAGHSYEVLAIPQTWPIHEMYYEACIRNLPRSELARSCFLRLERAVDYGHSGSAGTSIPEEVQELLSELKGLAYRMP